ncbi:serine/threonine-protein kinase 11-interacting protein [Sarcoptes scabiei]|nr:serine/threonine-protein kinase 11-interacting protein [Sarcoptes scabiei]
MDRLFDSLKGFFKKPPINIDNLAYRIHYRATFVVLVAFSLMVTSRQYFGDPIDCISKDDIPSRLLDTYCWIHTTFSIENAWKKRVGEEIPYPGVDKTTPNEKRIYHAYYQWVCFVLFFQAIFFYVPRFLWKAYEGGKIGQLVQGLNSPLATGHNDEKLLSLAKYLKFYENTHNHLFYFYTLTEILNFVNVLVQMMIMDRFLGGEFTTFGWNVLNFTEWEWSARFDPMIKVFPRLTKCTFHRYGSSGDVQRHDAMCILPINILNEKIYVFLWFWFYAVAVISLLMIIYRFATILLKPLRISNTHSYCRMVDKYDLEDMFERKPIGDWFFFDLLARNMDPINFKNLIEIYNQKPSPHSKV